MNLAQTLAGYVPTLYLASLITLLTLGSVGWYQLQAISHIKRLVVCVGIVILCTSLFILIASHIAPSSALSQFDIAFSEQAPLSISKSGLQALKLWTHFGDTLTLTLLCIFMSTLLIYQRYYVLAIGYIIAVGGNSMINPSLKDIFERARPIQEYGTILEQGWSFPSGHTSGTIVAYGMLAYIVIRVLPKHWHLPAIQAAILIAFTTGFSRIILRHHFASDVLAGMLSGTIWLIFCVVLMEYTQKRFLLDSRIRG